MNNILKVLLRLFPPAWQARYGEEFLDVLRRTHPTPAALLDVLRAALDAHLQPQSWHPQGGYTPDHLAARLARAQLSVLPCSALILGVALAFQKQAEHRFDHLGLDVFTQAVSTLFVTAGSLSALGLLCVCMPLALQANRRPGQHRRLVRVWLILPLLLIGGFVLLTFWLSAGITPTWAAGVWQAAFVFVAAASPGAIWLGLWQARLPAPVWRQALPASQMLCLTLLGVTLSILGEGLGVVWAAPQVFAPLFGVWLGSASSMVAACVLLALALWEAWRVGRRLAHP